MAVTESLGARSLRLFSLTAQWKADHESSHDITNLEVLLRTAGMCVVAFDAGRCDSNIGIDCFEYLFCAALDGAGIRFRGMCLNFLQTSPLEFSSRCIPFIDRPLTDQMVADVRAGQFSNLAGLLQELHRQGQ